MYRKILVANDGSPGALKALAAAIETAKRDGAALHMVTVEELPRFPATIDEAEEEKAEANHRLLPVIEAARAQARAAGVALETHLVPVIQSTRSSPLSTSSNSNCLWSDSWAMRGSTSKSSAARPSGLCAWLPVLCLW
jgi:hypothetical protein